MEEAKPYNSSMEAVAVPTFLRPRRVPDVPEDVDFLMDHLNDPNYDLKKRMPSPISSDSIEMSHKKIRMSYDPSEVDTESHFDSDRYSTSRAESRNSTAIEFDE